MLHPAAISLRDRLNLLFSTVADCTVLYRRGRLILVTFGALVAAGSFLWMLVTSACLVAGGLPSTSLKIFVAGAAASALASSHAFWWLGHLRVLAGQPLFGARQVGFVSWGGLAGVALFAISFARATGYPVLALCDAVARGMFAAYALGRVGCLTYGCCYGKAASGGVCYRNPHSKVVRERGDTRVPRHPTQVYSAALGVVLFLVLNALPYHQVPAGAVAAAGCLLYPIGRAWVEALRDRRRYVGARFTSGHLACLAMFLGGCALAFASGRTDGGPSPAPLTVADLGASASGLFTMLAVAALVFAVTSVHWKRVGTW
jgi:prolipoprotein diacylglyceryltransferase